jgi:hypothetical protein
VVQCASALPIFRIPKGVPVTLSDPPIVPQWLLLLKRYVHKHFFGGLRACCTSRRSRPRPLNGLKVTAEGAENDRQVASLTAMSCDLTQGFYFSKPLPSEAARKLVATNPFRGVPIDLCGDC